MGSSPGQKSLAKLSLTTSSSCSGTALHVVKTRPRVTGTPSAWKYPGVTARATAAGLASAWPAAAALAPGTATSTFHSLGAYAGCVDAPTSATPGIARRRVNHVS